MEKRHIKQFGKDISLLGFGCMRLPLLDPEDQKSIDYPLGEAMVDRAVAAGVNYFDTAFMYHLGGSEAFIGHALRKYPRASVYLADKLPVWHVKTPGDVDSLFAKQLERCGVSYFDFYLAHSLTRDYYRIFREQDVYAKLLRKKEEGLIRHLGFSFHDNADMLREILADHDWDFVQIQLNYIDWEACDAKTLYAILAERDIPVVIMEPLRGGALANLAGKAEALLKAADPTASPASWALRYAASLPRVMTVLSGMSAMEQVEDNIKTMTPFRPLSEAGRAVVEQAAAACRAAGAIPCTGCRYCMEDCPSGVGIPQMIAMYNHYLAGKTKIHFTNNYKTLKEGERAHNCTACGLCVERCPQGIAIPDHLREIAAFVAGKE
ncbi:MAG: aldo/keto reductase [Deltaproteobacteria bacterium]|jgi:predicted aldo/keto reductase-like oxidoreductase|nr:aldo/keto reductase [Deltaproteobacteria bacterium]